MNISARSITVAEAYQLRQAQPGLSLFLYAAPVLRIRQHEDYYHVHLTDDDDWFVSLQANAPLTMYVADKD